MKTKTSESGGFALSSLIIIMALVAFVTGWGLFGGVLQLALGLFTAAAVFTVAICESVWLAIKFVTTNVIAMVVAGVILACLVLGEVFYGILHFVWSIIGFLMSLIFGVVSWIFGGFNMAFGTVNPGTVFLAVVICYFLMESNRRYRKNKAQQQLPLAQTVPENDTGAVQEPEQMKQPEEVWHVQQEPGHSATV